LHGIFIMNGPSGNTVGGTEGYRNYIGANREHGVYISAANTNNVTHNYIGIDSTGSGFVYVGNVRSGVVVDGGAASTWIAYNVISGNGEHGVLISGSGTDFNEVHDNVIGADAQVTKPHPNGKHGVAIYGGAQHNRIGDDLVPSNIIVGSGWSGVVIVNTGSDHNHVLRNAIGTNRSGTATNLGNGFYGVHVVGGSGNEIRRNHIAHCGAHATRAGVRVEGASAIGNTISLNSIHDNSGKGIELANGGNAGLSAPTIFYADCRQVEGASLSSVTIEVFSDRGNEGRIYEGSGLAHSVLPQFFWGGSVTGPNVTVTATDWQGNTSEFSTPALGACLRALLPLVLK
jgi:hypothetical protein